MNKKKAKKRITLNLDDDSKEAIWANHQNNLTQSLVLAIDTIIELTGSEVDVLSYIPKLLAKSINNSSTENNKEDKDNKEDNTPSTSNDSAILNRIDQKLNSRKENNVKQNSDSSNETISIDKGFSAPPGWDPTSLNPHKN